jgi:DNA-directed RNA polymerase subunit L
MNKKHLIYILAFILIGMSVIGITYLLKNVLVPYIMKKNTVVYNGILYVNDRIVDENVSLYFIENSSYSKLPLVELFKALGADVKWVDNDTAEILFEGKKYTLSLSDITLFKEDDTTVNLIKLKDGGVIEYEILKQELILDSPSIKAVFYAIKHPIIEELDFTEKKVYIKTGDGSA